MRHDVNVEVKYQDEGEGNEEKLDESKEEETPMSQIAKVIEKNGMFLCHLTFKVNIGFTTSRPWKRMKRRSRIILKTNFGTLLGIAS